MGQLRRIACQTGALTAMNTTFEIIDAVLAQSVAGGPAVALSPECTLQQIGLTSLGLLRAVLALERQLGTKVLTPRGLATLRTVKDVHVLFSASPSESKSEGVP